MKLNFIYSISIVVLLLSILSSKVSFAQSEAQIIKEKYNATMVEEEEDEYFEVGYKIKKGNKYGAVNFDYELKIPIKYNSIKYYANTDLYVIVNKKKYYGLYNENLDILLKCKYLSIEKIETRFAKIKTKKGVGLFSFYMKKIIVEPIYDSLVLNEEAFDYSDGYAFVYKDSKIGVYALNSEAGVNLKVEWDSVVFVGGSIKDIEGIYYDDYYRLSKNDSVFFYKFDYEGISQIITEGYSSLNRARMEKLHADTIALDGNNGDGMFKARIASSKKWGLYQDYGDTIHVKIPPQFDSIINYSWNAPFTMVANDGLWGVYLWEWGDSIDYNREVPCLYQECKRVSSSSSGRFYMAAKLDNVWFWVDWYTGKRTTKQVWKAYDEMTLSYYDRSTYYSN